MDRKLASWKETEGDGGRLLFRLEACDQWCASGFGAGPIAVLSFIPMVWMISKFADDTKVGGIVDSEDGCQELQQDIDRQGRRTQEWLLEFNSDKCDVLNFGQDLHSEWQDFGECCRSVGFRSVGTQVLESGATGKQGGQQGFWHIGLYQSEY